jgi:glycosyltransferase involved in cell wall biosynthesis
VSAAGNLPRVVIGVPTFNRAGSLARALDSALAQDYANFAVLVSDNASTDTTPDVCQTYAAADHRLTYFRRPANVGATQNFIGLLERSEGELFMWLADDDWLDPGYLARCVQLLCARPDVVLAGGRAKYYQNGNLAREGQFISCQSEDARRRVLQYYRHVDDNAIFYGVMRLAAARKPLVPNCLGNDWLFMAAMAYQGKISTVDGVFVHRTLGGVSDNFGKLAKALALPLWQARIPLTFSLATYAARDIGWTNPVYRDMPAIPRRALALLVSCWMCAIKPAQELRRRLRRPRGAQSMETR